MVKSFKTKETNSLDDLLNIINHLRDPKQGCEWDIKQTAKTLSPHIIEEAYELVEALESENTESIIDELGDVLLQVIFQCQIANEDNLFKFKDVVDKAAKKMIRRHPHIFGALKEKRSIEEQKKFWEEIKKKERKEKGEKNTTFSKFNKFKPPINQAIKLQKTASSLGMDFSNISEVILKIEEETLEVKEALKNSNYEEKKEEIGDLFFSIINLTRLLDFDPELCIYEANKKFAKRCEVYFSLKELENHPLSKEEDYKLWQLTKKIESKE
tara:strand:- start:770 stop:1579 length:810 start_codon:yes stop_codon:yes gene_type:complete